MGTSLRSCSSRMATQCAALFVTALIGLASINNSVGMADNVVGGVNEIQDLAGDAGVIHDDTFLQTTAAESDPINSIVVPIQPGLAKSPEPTIETLMPKHIKKQTEKFQTANDGKTPSKLEEIELKRLAVQSAADEINSMQQTKDALEIAKQGHARLIRQIKRDKETIDTISKNEEYAARKAYGAADRKVKFFEGKYNKRQTKAEKAIAKLNEEKEHTKLAYEKRMKAKKESLVARGRLVEEQKKVDDDAEAVMKGKTILAKSISTVEESKDTVMKKTDFLNNIEAHESDARLQYRQAKIQKEYEEDDAGKVSMLLKRLSAKKRAVFKFTKNLNLKSQRDFRAAEAGIEKAKADYAKAKGQYDDFTKKAGKYEKKLIDTQRLVRLAKNGVVMGIHQGRDSMAIKSAENYSSLKKKETKDKVKVDAEDINAKGQNKLMGAAMSELAKAEALESVARKQKEMVKQHRITMRSQVEKIDFLKNEVKKHTEKAEDADKRAKDALHKVKNMRKDAIRHRDEARARERYAEHIDDPMAKRALHKATKIYDRNKISEKIEYDNISELSKDMRDAIIKARTLKKKRDLTKEFMEKAVSRAKHAKKQMTDAENKRDKTLSHNKAKMKAINERLDLAAKAFKATQKPSQGLPQDWGKKEIPMLPKESLGETRQRSSGGRIDEPELKRNSLELPGHE